MKRYVREPSHLLEPFPRLLLEARKQSEDERFGRWSQVLLQWEVEALIHVEDDGLDACSGVLEEGEEPATPGREVAPQVVGLSEGQISRAGGA